MSAFGARGIVIPLTILRLVFLSQAYSSDDTPYDSLNAAIVTQLSLNFAIILACFPFLKTFMDHVQNGLFTTDLRLAPGVLGDSYGAKHSYALGSVGRSKNTAKNSQSNSSGSHGKSIANTTIGGTEPWEMTPTPGVVTTARGGETSLDESRASSGGSDRMIIKQTTAVTVQSERRVGGGMPV